MNRQRQNIKILFSTSNEKFNYQKLLLQVHKNKWLKFRDKVSLIKPLVINIY